MYCVLNVVSDTDILLMYQYCGASLNETAIFLIDSVTLKNYIDISFGLFG